MLVHPGGPLWKSKDEGAWTIPKGEIKPDEPLLEAACREFEEETGHRAQAPFLELGEIQQKSGKIVTAWAFEGDFDPAKMRSNTFEMEWPPHSGRKQSFPEMDKADFFTVAVAKVKINAAQSVLLDRLVQRIGVQKS